MRKVDIYIEVTEGNYSKIELYNDEDIQINSSIQNIQDLAKVYTDFTQSFTVPASSHNNNIFEHFYESSVDGRDHNLRRNAYIEIQTTPFRSGKIQLEKANVVNNRAESYSITFYGDLMSLKDKFGDDTLKDLDLSPYSFLYSGANVKTRLTSSGSYNVRFPLISSNRIWTYGDGTNTDISAIQSGIKYTELFPALRVRKIFDAIQTKYGVTFDSLFFNRRVFTDLYLWLKNAPTFKALTETVPFTMDDIQVNTDGRVSNVFNTVALGDTKEISVFAQGVASVADTDVYLDVYFNNKLWQTFKLKSTGTYFNNELFYFTNLDSVLTFKVRASNICTVTSGIRIEYKDVNDSNVKELQFRCVNKALSTSTLDPSLYAPNIKVSDFVSGVLKMFNLTCYAKTIDTFQVEPLDDWYSKGAVVDITEHIITDEIEVERHKLYKEVSFNYEKSESFLNKEYFNETTNATREFGDVKQTFPNYDGEEYKVELPFENIHFAKNSITNVNEPPKAYVLDSKTSTESYENKPILLYLEEQKSTSFWYFGSAFSQITSYMPLTNQITYNGKVYANHFSVEPSAFDGSLISNTLYSQYYDSYLSNLFNKQNRLTKLKALLPISLLTSLKLNDRLIIRDKRYIINELKCNLTSGEVDLELINDFRPVVNVNLPTVSALGTTVEVPLFADGNYNTFNYNSYDSIYGAVVAKSTSTDEDTLIEIIIPENTTGTPISWDILKNYQPYATIYQHA